MSLTKKDMNEIYADVLTQKISPADRHQKVMIEKIERKERDIFSERRKNSKENEIQQNVKKKIKTNDVPKKEDKDIEQTKTELKKAVYSGIYEDLLKEYYSYKKSLYKHKAKDGDLYISNNQFKKLLEYEVYLKKIDVNYKNNLGDSFISKDNKSIGELENKLSTLDMKYQKTTFKNHEENLENIEDLNNQIEEKAEQIERVESDLEKGYDTNKAEELALLNEEYLSLNKKMHLLTPNIVELNRQQDDYERREEVQDKKVGVMYDKKKARAGAISKHNVRTKKRLEGKEEVLGLDDEKDTADINQERLDKSNRTTLECLIDVIEEAVKKGDLKVAKKLAKDLDLLAGKDELNSVIDDNVEKENKEDIRNLTINDVNVEEKEQVKEKEEDLER